MQNKSDVNYRLTTSVTNSTNNTRLVIVSLVNNTVKIVLMISLCSYVQQPPHEGEQCKPRKQKSAQQ